MAEMIDYDSMTDRELLIAANRKADQILAAMQRVEELTYNAAAQVGPILDSLQRDGIGGLMKMMLRG